MRSYMYGQYWLAYEYQNLFAFHELSIIVQILLVPYMGNRHSAMVYTDCKGPEHTNSVKLGSSL